MPDELEQIVAAYKQTALDLLKDPDNPEALTTQFTLLAARGQRTEAHLAIARRCEAIGPDKFIAVFNLASAEMRAGLYRESVETFRRALTLATGEHQATTLQHIGLACYTAGDPVEALKWYQRVKALKDDKELRQSIAIAELMNGRLSALYEFECEHHTPRRKPIADSGIPRWMSEDLTGKTLIVAHEQGFGDTIQFARFIRQLKPGRLIWSGPGSLSALMSDNFKCDAMLDEDGPFSADYYCSPISACGALKTEYADVDPQPYMTAVPVKLPERGKLKIGLAWAGNVDYAHDADRSIALDELMPLLEIPGTAFYSLQVGRGEEDITRLGLDGMIANLGHRFTTWHDTARAIAAMDLVIACDTGAAHLAGAIGKPVFILLPFANCWRWMRDRADTPWYSSMRLFRQSIPRDWKAPVLSVQYAIKDMMHGR